MRVEEAPEGGKFRAVAASGLDGTAGAWGNSDFLCVTIDGNGEIAASSAGDCDGVIWTKEGRKDGVANNNQVIGGKKYTVIQRGLLTETEDATSPALSAGDDLFATASGDITASPATGDIYVGSVLSNGKMTVNVNGRPASA